MTGDAIDKIVNGNYYNFGKVIDETIVADTALVYSSWYKGDFLWARNLLLTPGIDQSFDIFIYRKTPEGIVDWGWALVSGGGSTSSTFSTYIIPSYSGGLLGYEFRFAIKNVSGGAATTRAILYVQAFS